MPDRRSGVLEWSDGVPGDRVPHDAVHRCSMTDQASGLQTLTEGAGWWQGKECVALGLWQFVGPVSVRIWSTEPC